MPAWVRICDLETTSSVVTCVVCDPRLGHRVPEGHGRDGVSHRRPEVHPAGGLRLHLGGGSPRGRREDQPHRHPRVLPLHQHPGKGDPSQPSLNPL